MLNAKQIEERAATFTQYLREFGYITGEIAATEDADEALKERVIDFLRRFERDTLDAFAKKFSKKFMATVETDK